MMRVTALSLRGSASSRRGAPLFATLMIASLATAAVACGQRTAKAEAPPVSEEPGATTLKTQLQPLPGAVTGALEEDEPELRRGYGVVDMRFDPCVTTQGNSALHGEACPPGFVVYGPYVSVPAKSTIEITFQIEPSHEVEL